jgi:hypothetical protein
MRILGVLYGAGRYRLEQEEEYDAHLGRALWCRAECFCEPKRVGGGKGK